jgi:hypothetical protein
MKSLFIAYEVPKAFGELKWDYQSPATASICGRTPYRLVIDDATNSDGLREFQGKFPMLFESFASALHSSCSHLLATFSSTFKIFDVEGALRRR